MSAKNHNSLSKTSSFHISTTWVEFRQIAPVARHTGIHNRKIAPSKHRIDLNLRLSPPTVLIQLVIIQFLPQETSTKVEGLQGRSRPREESFQAAEEMNRHGGAKCFVYLGEHPIYWLCSKHMTCVLILYICKGTWWTGKKMKSYHVPKWAACCVRFLCRWSGAAVFSRGRRLEGRW